MKYLVTSGCSFSADTHCWPVHLAKIINAEHHYQLGKGSAGNDYINRSIVRKVSNLLSRGVKSNEIFVAAMWSGQDRFSHYFTTEVFKLRTHFFRPYYSATNPLTYPDDDTHGKWLLTNVGFDNNFTKTYYKYYYDQTDMSIKTHERILSTQLFLEKHNINYVFSQYKDKILDYPKPSKKHFEHFENEISWNKFIPDACYEWCKKNMPDDFKHENDDHPTLVQHKAYTRKVMYPFIERHCI